MVTNMMKLIQGIAGWVMQPIISLLDFPAIPESFNNVIQQIFGYMESGMAFIDWICPLNLIQPCIDAFIVIYLVEHGYNLVMWVLKKIPMIGIE